MIARLPPEFTVMVMPEDTVKGPVAVAFSVASIVVSTSTDRDWETQGVI